MEGFCLFCFYLLLNTELCIQRAHRENIDKWLVRLQISVFILMTLQNTLRSTIHICREILTLWYNVTAPGICNVVKQIIYWNHKILIWLQTLFECVHWENGSYLLGHIYLLNKNVKKKSPVYKEHYYWYWSVNHHNATQIFIIYPMNSMWKWSQRLAIPSWMFSRS